MQSRLMSVVESISNIVVGYGLAVLTQLLVFPMFGLHASLAENLGIGAATFCAEPSTVLQGHRYPRSAASRALRSIRHLVLAGTSFTFV